MNNLFGNNDIEIHPISPKEKAKHNDCENDAEDRKQGDEEAAREDRNAKNNCRFIREGIQDVN